MKRLTVLFVLVVLMVSGAVLAQQPRPFYQNEANVATDTLTIHYALKGRFGDIMASAITVYSDSSLTLSYNLDNRSEAQQAISWMVTPQATLQTIAGKYTYLVGRFEWLHVENLAGANTSIVGEY